MKKIIPFHEITFSNNLFLISFGQFQEEKKQISALNLSDLSLLQNTEDLVKKEKQFTIKIIEHLQEIQRRKAFLERGCSSLFLIAPKS